MTNAETRKVADWELADHGTMNPQFFQGAGISCTEWEDVATGVGDNPREALEDALEQLASAGWDTADIDVEDCPETPSVCAYLESEIQSEIGYFLKGPMMAANEFPSIYFDSKTDREDVRLEAATLLRKLRKLGADITILSTGEEWEAREPDDAPMVPGWAGVYSIESNEEDVRESFQESEVVYMLSVYVTSKEDD